MAKKAAKPAKPQMMKGQMMMNPSGMPMMTPDQMPSSMMGGERKKASKGGRKGGRK
jgi:hypothetical protein